MVGMEGIDNASHSFIQPSNFQFPIFRMRGNMHLINLKSDIITHYDTVSEQFEHWVGGFIERTYEKETY